MSLQFVVESRKAGARDGTHAARSVVEERVAREASCGRRSCTGGLAQAVAHGPAAGIGANHSFNTEVTETLRAQRRRHQRTASAVAPSACRQRPCSPGRPDVFGRGPWGLCVAPAGFSSGLRSPVDSTGVLRPDPAGFVLAARRDPPSRAELRSSQWGMRFAGFVRKGWLGSGRQV